MNKNGTLIKKVVNIMLFAVREVKFHCVRGRRFLRVFRTIY